MAISDMKMARSELAKAFEGRIRTERISSSLREFSVWGAITVAFFVEVFVFNYFFSYCVFTFWVSEHIAEYLSVYTSRALLVLSALNMCSCALYVLKYYLCSLKYDIELNEKQIRLLGLQNEVQIKKKINAVSETKVGQRKTDFLSDWLPALRFGSLRSVLPFRGDELRKSEESRLNMMHKTSGFLTGIGNSLEAKVGWRIPPLSHIFDPIRNHFQLEEYLERSARNNRSILSCRSSSENRSHMLSSRSFSNSRSFSPSRYTSVYQPGTSLKEDEPAKIFNDENGVVSVVRGNRLKYSKNRVSLLPIPLNLIDVDINVSSSRNNGKSTLSDSSGLNGDREDGVSFRIIHNASRQSGKSSSSSPVSLHRSNSMERRGTSPRKFSVRSSSTLSSSTSQHLPEAYLGLSRYEEIMSHYKLGSEEFSQGISRLRLWMCETILKPLSKNIDEMNAIFSREYIQLHLKIGRSSVEALQSALSSKLELISTPLPYLLAYLKVHEKQAYLVKRIQDLCDDAYMTEYNWRAGGSEPLDISGEGKKSSYTPAEGPWGEHLPTDAHLVWSLFCTYLDMRIDANPIASDVQIPFSSIYFLRKPCKPSSLQCCKDSFYIYQSSNHPPHFELVIDGGRERLDTERGPRNLWRTLLLFIQHARLFNNNCAADSKPHAEADLRFVCTDDFKRSALWTTRSYP